MDDSNMMMLLAAFAGLLCLASVALLVGVFVAWSRRQAESKPARPATPARPAPRVAASAPSGTPSMPRGPSVASTSSPRVPPPAKTEPPHGIGLPAPDYSEDEMPTVVVASPTRPSGASPTPPAPPPSRRSAGATIIAFDDDDDDGEAE